MALPHRVKSHFYFGSIVKRWQRAWQAAKIAMAPKTLLITEPVFHDLLPFPEQSYFAKSDIVGFIYQLRPRFQLIVLQPGENRLSLSGDAIHPDPYGDLIIFATTKYINLNQEVYFSSGEICLFHQKFSIKLIHPPGNNS